MVLPPLFPLYIATFLVACLVAYGRTLWFGKKRRVSVALCSLLNTVSFIAMILLGVACWEKRTLLSLVLLAGAAGLWVWTSVWENNLKQRQEEDSATDKRETR